MTQAMSFVLSRPSYGLLLGAGLAAIAAARVDLSLALFPAAVVFGWTQIGGL